MSDEVAVTPSGSRSFVLRGGTVVDGSGAAPARTDVEVHDGRIKRVGSVDAQPDVETVDVTDLVIAPGFIDIHTHYDAQILWDPGLGSSARHGVTTVVTGNCGFTLAPTRPRDRSAIVHLLRTVEGMSADVLEAGIDWTFETFPQYLETLRSKSPALNVGALVGHDAVRRYAMGEAAQDRTATVDERRQMQSLVETAVRAGAIGFSTDLSGAHIDASGRPVPSMFADEMEVLDLCRSAARAGATLIELACGRRFDTDSYVDIARATGIGVTPTALLSGLHPREEIEGILGCAAAASGLVLPQVTPRPRLHYLTLAIPFEWVRMSDAFSEGLERGHDSLIAMYRDQEWRERATGELTGRGGEAAGHGGGSPSRTDTT